MTKGGEHHEQAGNRFRPLSRGLFFNSRTTSKQMTWWMNVFVPFLEDFFSIIIKGSLIDMFSN